MFLYGTNIPPLTSINADPVKSTALAEDTKKRGGIAAAPPVFP